MTDEIKSPGVAYPPPVDQLLTYGDARTTSRDWPDYRRLGLGPEHIPDLMRMATDPALNLADEDTLEVWAPVHAWRALGQFQAAEAVEPLLGLQDELEGEDDWIFSEMPRVYGLIGPAAIPALAAYLADPQHGGSSRLAAGEGLAEIGQRHPEARAACITAISSVLEQHDRNDEFMNGGLISNLIDLKAAEAAPVMAEAFAAGDVDETVVGDWEDVQIALGLLSERITPRPRYDIFAKMRAREEPRVISRTEETRPLVLNDEDAGSVSPVPPSVARSKDARKAKAKRKMAAQSRKQNKKRR